MSTIPTRAVWQDWAAIVTLGIGSFAIVTAELAPIGLLSGIGSDLNTPPARVGLIVTLYAWIAAVAALLSVTVLGGIPRRLLLILLMIVLAFSATASASAGDFGALMAARIIGAIAHGAFWAMIGTVGAQIVPPQRVGLATSIIFGGVSVASVLGIPLANLIGSGVGWRMAFWAVAALSFLVAAAIWLAVPKLQGVKGINVSTLVRIVANRRFRRLFAATLLAITAHFTAFTYVEHFLASGSSVSAKAVPPLLLAFGIAGVAANFLTGALVDARLKLILSASLTLSGVSLLLLSAIGSDLGVIGVAVTMIAWGGAVAAMFVCFQTWVLKEAGDDALPASAIYVALFNLSIGLGALLGSIVLARMGLSQLYLFAGMTTLCGLFAIVLLSEPRSRATPAE